MNRKNPLCIEAAYAILDLSMTFSDLIHTIQGFSQSLNVAIPDWFVSLLAARASKF